MGINIKGRATVRVNQGPLPITQGGTKHDTASGAINALMPPQTGNATKVLISNGTEAEWGVAISSGLSTPAGVNKQIQFNDNGVLGASTLLFDKSTNTLTVDSIIPITSVDIGATSLKFNNMFLKGLASLTYVNETVIDGGDTGSNILTPDASRGTVYRYNVTGNFTLNELSNVVPGTHMTIILKQDNVGNHVLSSTMKFADGNKILSSEPGTHNIIHVFYNGTDYYAVLSKFLEVTDLVLDLLKLRYVLCAPYVTLSPNIISGEITGHTFLWEQISGRLVDWGVSDLHSLEVTFAYTSGIREDTAFRLWIDKGKQDEYFLDTIIYATPTDTLPAVVAATGWQGIRALDPQINVTLSVFPALLTGGNIGAIVNNNSPVVVYWTLPTTFTDISATAIEVNSVGYFDQRKYVDINNLDRYYTTSSDDSVKIRVYFTAVDKASRSVLTPPMRLPKITDDNLTAVVADENINWAITAKNGGLTRTLNMVELFPFNSPSDLGTYGASAKGYKSSKAVTILTMSTYFYEDIGTYGASAKGFSNSKITTLLWRSTIGG